MIGSLVDLSLVRGAVDEPDVVCLILLRRGLVLLADQVHAARPERRRLRERRQHVRDRRGVHHCERCGRRLHPRPRRAAVRNIIPI